MRFPTLPPSLSRRETLAGWTFVLPACIGFLLFYLLPTFRAFYIGMTQWTLLTPAKWVGFENYVRLVRDGEFYEALWTTAYYCVLNIPLQTVLGLAFAVLLDRWNRGVSIRALLLVPFLLSNVVAALLWMLVLDPSLGFFNAALTRLGFPAVSFFTSESLALPTVALINIWRHVGVNALILYAGLQTIPRHLYEAAQLEGAGEWRCFWTVTLPLLRPILVFVVATGTIGSFQIFDTVAVATQGGPGTSTRTLMWYIYQTGFGGFRMGYASAISCAMLILLAAITLVQLRVMRGNHSDLD